MAIYLIWKTRMGPEMQSDGSSTTLPIQVKISSTNAELISGKYILAGAIFYWLLHILTESYRQNSWRRQWTPLFGFADYSLLYTTESKYLERSATDSVNAETLSFRTVQFVRRKSSSLWTTIIPSRQYGKRCQTSVHIQDHIKGFLLIVHGSLARAGKVKSQTPKVDKQEKKKTPKGRAKKRILYNRRCVELFAGGAEIDEFFTCIHFQLRERHNTTGRQTENVS